jgi:hypothetical protein
MKKILSICLAAGIFSWFLSCKPLQAKREVTGITVTLRLHPDEVTIRDKDSVTHYLFFSLEQKCLLISSKRDIFEAIQQHLPEKNTAGNSVVIEATSIDPFVDFKKKDLAAVSKRLGIELNRFKVYKIFNYALSTSSPGGKPSGKSFFSN